MNKTLALLLDSYRELNSKRLFWVTLILSGLVVLAMACVGVAHGAPFAVHDPNQVLGDTHLTFLGWQSPIPAILLGATDPASLYKFLFSYIGVGLWLSFIGSILGLVSTAGIFPDFMAGGSIDLYLSKPVSRLWLFLTKYVGGLLFVTLQMSVFALASFLLLGIRGHAWEPVIFLSIPLVVLMFSYLFAFCVLLGVITRSTIAALMLTILFWFFCWGFQKADLFVTFLRVENDATNARDDRDLARYQAELPRMPETRPSEPAFDFDAFNRPGRRRRHEQPEPLTRTETEQRIAELQAKQAERTPTLDNIGIAIRCALAPLPKTTRTTDLLDRELTRRAELPGSTDDSSGGGGGEAEQAELKRRMDATSGAYIIGTSAAFEVVVLALAAWLFCRRDY